MASILVTTTIIRVAAAVVLAVEAVFLVALMVKDADAVVVNEALIARTLIVEKMETLEVASKQGIYL